MFLFLLLILVELTITCKQFFHSIGLLSFCQICWGPTMEVGISCSERLLSSVSRRVIFFFFQNEHWHVGNKGVLKYEKDIGLIIIEDIYFENNI